MRQLKDIQCLDKIVLNTNNSYVKSNSIQCNIQSQAMFLKTQFHFSSANPKIKKPRLQSNYGNKTKGLKSNKTKGTLVHERKWLKILSV